MFLRQGYLDHTVMLNMETFKAVALSFLRCENKWNLRIPAFDKVPSPAHERWGANSFQVHCWHIAKILAYHLCRFLFEPYWYCFSYPANSSTKDIFVFT